MSGRTPDPKSLLEPGETWRSTLFDDLPVPTFHEELYRTAQAVGPSSDAIDAVLVAHRREHGEPEQVAYAQQRDGLHDRPLPLVSTDGGVGDVGLQRYLDEHRAWNPVTQRERALSSQTQGMSA